MFEYIEGLLLGSSKQNFEIDLHGNFGFHVEPSFKGAVPLHSLSIIVSCYEDKEKRKPIDFDVKWCKLMDGELFEIKDYSSKYYHVNPSDIDLKIRAVITSTTLGHSGTAFLTVGPIMLDGSLKPELEGLIVNKAASFRCTIISVGGQKVNPNLSVIKVVKPHLEIIYDPKMVERESDAKKTLYQPLKVDFEKDMTLKVKVDSHNINNAAVSYSKEGENIVVLINFDNRMQRDVFYTYFKLMRMLKSKILQDQDNEYDRLLSMPWCFLNAGKDVDRYDQVRGYHFILGGDAIREQLKTMVRLNKTLQDENVHLLDSMDIIEQDLQRSMKEFENLLEDGKVKNTKNIRKYERSQMSIMQESSIIIDDLREKNKRKKKANEEQIIESTRSLQDEVTSIKKVNEILKKEIEIHKSGPKRPTLGTGSRSGHNMESLYLSAIQVDYSLNIEYRRQFDNG